MISEVIELALSLNNPFGVVDRKGKLIKFDTTAQAYLFVLLDLFYTFPRGFVDIYLYINERQFKGRKSADEMLEDAGEYVIIEWQNPDLGENEKLKKTLNILLSTTCSVLDKTALSLALQHFQEYVEKYYKDHPQTINTKFQIFYL